MFCSDQLSLLKVWESMSLMKRRFTSKMANLKSWIVSNLTLPNLSSRRRARKGLVSFLSKKKNQKKNLYCKKLCLRKLKKMSKNLLKPRKSIWNLPIPIKILKYKLKKFLQNLKLARKLNWVVLKHHRYLSKCIYSIKTIRMHQSI